MTPRLFLRSHWLLLAFSLSACGPLPDAETELVDQAAFSGTLPSGGWVLSPLGTQGKTGSVQYESVTKTFRTDGAGSGMGGTSDNFLFLNRPHSGDGQITARITGVSGPNDKTRHGVMIRANNTDKAAPFVYIYTTRNGTLAATWRAATGQATKEVPVLTGRPANGWLWLWRRGNTIGAAYSSNGWTYSDVDIFTLQGLPSELRYGIAVSSYSTTALARSYVDNVRVAKLPMPWSYQDIGTPSLPGTATYDLNTNAMKVKGGGSGAHKDQTGFQFTNRPIAGCHTEMVARLASVKGPSGSAGGLMIRASLAADAPYAVVYPEGTGVYFSARKAAGGTVTQRSVAVSGPWMKLVKSSSTTVSLSTSTDGVNWQPAGEVTGGSYFGGCGQAYFGFFSRSGSTSATSEAAFDAISFKIFQNQAADLDAWVDLDPPRQRRFAMDDPDVAAGCATFGDHWILPFRTRINNHGPTAVVLGNPADRPDVFTTSSSGEKEIGGFRKVQLKNAMGTVLATRTLSQCLSDAQKVDAASPVASAQFNCATKQGLSPGWGTASLMGFACQYFVLDTVPDGDLTVDFTANANRYVVEDFFSPRGDAYADDRQIAKTNFTRCDPGQSRCVGADRQVCAADSSWQTQTCAIPCGQQCSGMCAVMPDFTCSSNDFPGTHAFCDVRGLVTTCDGDPSGEPCVPNPDNPYLYVYKKNANGSYTKVTSDYWVCDWNEETPMDQRVWHTGG